MTTILLDQAPVRNEFRWTVDIFYRAANAGVFDNPKEWELINGQLWKREKVNPPHASTRRILFRLLQRQLEPVFVVMQESPLHLGSDQQPIPDILVATGREEDYISTHPTNREAVLVVEVADTTVARDTGEKALLYAQAGITDYWVNLVSERVLVVHRDPTPEGYQSVMRLTEADTLSPLCAPDILLAVRELVARPVSDTASPVA
jgi:Uma2 family endonuclease